MGVWGVEGLEEAFVGVSGFGFNDIELDRDRGNLERATLSTGGQQVLSKALAGVRHLKDDWEDCHVLLLDHQVRTFSAGTFTTCIGSEPTRHRREQALPADTG